MKPNQAEQIEWIKEHLRKGLKRKDLLPIFAERWRKVSDRTFERLLQQAMKQLETEISKIQEVAIENIKERANELVELIMPIVERQAILSEIARGRRTIQQVIQTKYGIETIEQFPNHSDITKAISELNKMDGGYSPVKVDHNVVGITAIEVMHTEAIPIDNNESASQ